jgi:hypothetical protein
VGDTEGQWSGCVSKLQRKRKRSKKKKKKKKEEKKCFFDILVMHNLSPLLL